MRVERSQKEDPKITEKIEESISKVRSAIQKAESVMESKDPDIWEGIKEIINDKIEEKERILKAFDHAAQRDVDIALAEKRQLVALYEIFENVEATLVILHKRLSDLTDRLDARKND